MLIMAYSFADRDLKDEAASLLRPVIEWSGQAGAARLNEEARELLQKVAS